MIKKYCNWYNIELFNYNHFFNLRELSCF
jgi:hypothetical protein